MNDKRFGYIPRKPFIISKQETFLFQEINMHISAYLPRLTLMKRSDQSKVVSRPDLES